jgi:proteic killer suppression protein
VIRSWRHKGLQELFETGRSRKVRQDQCERIIRRLDALNAAGSVKEMDIPGFGLHKLKGNPPRSAIAVNGPWRITFEWRDGDAHAVDLEQYH